MIAVMAPIELLRFQPESPQTAGLFRALVAANPDVHITDTYRGQSDLLMLWGPGSPLRFEAMRRQVAKGGHVLCWDAAYWHRETKFRVSIDAAHPQRWIMSHDWPVDRFVADGVAVSDAWDPTGPIIVAGIGEKATTQYGADVVAGWERAQIARCQAQWSRPIRYRFKKTPRTPPIGTSLCSSSSPIDAILAGASLVITWHSNVAIDAIRLGIPVVCQDGAAAAVCPSQVNESTRPLSVDVRDQFLANLAWFQWAPQEASKCWAFLAELLA